MVTLNKVLKLHYKMNNVVYIFKKFTFAIMHTKFVIGFQFEMSSMCKYQIMTR